jgi:translocon-associated protein subunit gamma
MLISYSQIIKVNESACLVHRILWKKNEVADYEATTFSIFYNNTLFLTLVIFSSFYILKTFTPAVYPFCVSTTGWMIKIF